MIHLYANPREYTPVKNCHHLKVGDKVTCVEDRAVSNVDLRSGLKNYHYTETIPFLTNGKVYEVVQIQWEKRKVQIIADDEVARFVTFDRLSVKNES